MHQVRPFAIAGALIVSLVGAGHAADLPALPPPSTPPTVVCGNIFCTGWYLRGDLGERWGFMTSVDSTGGGATVDSSGNATMLGFGAGFRFLKFLRGDLTFDSATEQSFRGTFASPGDVTAKIQTSTALLNLYADLGTWYWFTPYIGAGLGTARVFVSDFQGPLGLGGGVGSHSQWNLAWAAMGGTAITISHNLQLDVGYRYLAFGTAHTADGSGGNTAFRNLGAHELRVGLRWNFDDLGI